MAIQPSFCKPVVRRISVLNIASIKKLGELKRLRTSCHRAFHAALDAHHLVSKGHTKSCYRAKRFHAHRCIECREQYQTTALFAAAADKQLSESSAACRIVQRERTGSTSANDSVPVAPGDAATRKRAVTNKIVSRLNILIIEGQPKRETGRDTSAFLNFWIATKRTRTTTTTTALKEKKTSLNIMIRY